MAVMRFLTKNKLDTSTLITVHANNTSTVGNSFDRDPQTKWTTVGFGTNTSTNFTISLSSAQVIDKIYIQNHNLRQFRMFYNGVTANAFTPDINVSSNSATSHYFDISSITVSSVTMQVDLAQTADTEKQVGEIYIGGTIYTFERNPSAKDYKPVIDRTSVIHKMSNGGVVQFIVDDKFKANIKWEFLSTTSYNTLLNLYETGTAFVFMPFPTTTSWDGKAYEVAWTNDFDFNHSESNKNAGYGGQIVIQETA